MERKCIFCDTSIDIKKHGLTKFCSVHCRNKFYYKNKASKELDGRRNISFNDENLTHETIKVEEKDIGNSRQQDLPVHTTARNDDSFIYSLIEAKFDAKNECNLYKLKCEQLEEEKRRLEKELFDANAEIDSLEVEEDNGPLSFLSGLPENVISGVSKAAFENEKLREIITSFFSSKK